MDQGTGKRLCQSAHHQAGSGTASNAAAGGASLSKPAGRPGQDAAGDLPGGILPRRF